MTVLFEPIESSSISARELNRQKKFPAAREHRFPSPSAKREAKRVPRATLVNRAEDVPTIETGSVWVTVSLEEQLFRWLRTMAFRELNSSFSFPPVEAPEFDDDFTVEEVSLAFRLHSLALAEADLPATIQRVYREADVSEIEDPELAAFLAGGFATEVIETAPAIIRSGIKVVDHPTNRRDRSTGIFSTDDLLNKCLRVSRFVLEVWNPDFVLRLHNAGVKGGRIGGSTSKRGPAITIQMLDALPPLMDDYRAAHRLGCSVQTVRRVKARRAALAAQQLQHAD